MYLFMFVYEVSGIKEIYRLHIDVNAVFFSPIDDEKFLGSSQAIHGLCFTLSFTAGDRSGFDKP